MAYLGKEFHFEREENYENFVQSLDLSPEEKNNFQNYKPIIKLVKNGDSYTISFIHSGSPKDVTFTPGKEFVETSNSFESKTVFTVDGDTFTQVKDFGPKGKLTFKRIFSPNQLIIELRSSNWDGVARRYYTA